MARDPLSGFGLVIVVQQNFGIDCGPVGGDPLVVWLIYTNIHRSLHAGPYRCSRELLDYGDS
jgi:hypothetical protein